MLITEALDTLGAKSGFIRLENAPDYLTPQWGMIGTVVNQMQALLLK